MVAGVRDALCSQVGRGYASQQLRGRQRDSFGVHRGHELLGPSEDVQAVEDPVDRTSELDGHGVDALVVEGHEFGELSRFFEGRELHAGQIFRQSKSGFGGGVAVQDECRDGGTSEFFEGRDAVAPGHEFQTVDGLA